VKGAMHQGIAIEEEQQIFFFEHFHRLPMFYPLILYQEV